ncbi:hypothetical protein Tsubulata_017012 [Turnera subulata]|uniref:Uncharacterized protein n=1 Tax=Turnera subulata TaxID=218843 RepID=A0A9Q0FK30_9ROSI|nr:hypothetical protein Tsubulata_017012 [Turnera subulata]
MAIKNQDFLLFTIPFFLLSLLTHGDPVTGGTWVLLHESIGISAMHMQLLKTNKVVIFDRTDFGPSNLTVTLDKCRFNDEAVKPIDCTAHSVLYDLVSNTFRPLFVRTNTFCSSGSVDPDGTLVQTGGDHQGERIIRTLTPCDDRSCDWVELPTPLWNRRWYASNQILPDGRIFILGGRKVFTYEFYPKNWFLRDNITLPFLMHTRDRQEENNLYPFLHLLPDGNLFIFANNRSILFNYARNAVIKEYPVMPGGVSRNYPSTGSSVLLPLRLTGEGSYNASKLPEAEVMICGGAPPGSHIKAFLQQIYVEASRTCGRLRVSDPKPVWVMELMPTPRVMNDMVLLPTGEVLIINGATNGSAGWESAVNPVYNPVLYMPDVDPGRRFLVLNPSRKARLYHSTAVLLPDGRVLVGGSNPHRTYNFTAYPYPTELSLEAYYPYYLNPVYTPFRPSILTVESEDGTVWYGRIFSVTFVLPGHLAGVGLSVVVMAPPFATHSFSMNQRMVVLNLVDVGRLSVFAYKAMVMGPPNANVAPPGYYMLFVLHLGIPSLAVWVRVR